MQKVTIKEQFVAVAEVLAAAGRDDLVEFVNGRIAILDKKTATKSKAVAEKQAANEALKENIIKALTDMGKAVNITELKDALKAYDETEYTTPKISALLKQLKDEDKITRTLEKKTPYFAVV
jgi:uncharacterized protein YqeY